MDNENNEMLRVIEDETPKMGFFKRLVSIFAAPAELARNIRIHPSIGPALLSALAVSLLTLPFMGKLTALTLEKTSEIMLTRYGQDFLNFTESTQAAQGSAVIAALGSAVSILIVYPIVCFLQAFALFLVGKIAKGQAKYAQYASVCAHALVITAVGGVISSAVMASVGTLLDVTSLAAVFMPNGDFSMFSYNLLAAVGIFGIWGYIVIALGVKEINGFTAARAAVVTGVTFLLAMLVTAATSSASIMFTDMAVKSMGFA
ncbi:MAG: YIP1 family protein [Clostridiales Family XIII bacterium]|jgi:hypothetical protein|nr:YIP1 family protein [Clostridiales Family XIII bacterium]